MYLDRLDQLILACPLHYIALHGQKERLYMSANESKLYTFKEREWVVTGWAEGQMETEREDDKGQKVIVMQPYYQLFVISPVSSYKSDNYSANGMKAEKLRCVSNAVWKDLKPLEVVNLYFDEKKRVSLAQEKGDAGRVYRCFCRAERGLLLRPLSQTPHPCNAGRSLLPA